MKEIITSDPDVLKFQTGGGCLMLFGLPFLLTGLFVLSIPLNVLPLEGTPPPWYVAVPFGAVFFLVGFGLMFGRKVVTLDRRQKRLTTEQRAIVTLKRKEVFL